MQGGQTYWAFPFRKGSLLLSSSWEIMAEEIGHQKGKVKTSRFCSKIVSYDLADKILKICVIIVSCRYHDDIDVIFLLILEYQCHCCCYIVNYAGIVLPMIPASYSRWYQHHIVDDTGIILLILLIFVDVSGMILSMIQYHNTLYPLSRAS